MKPTFTEEDGAVTATAVSVTGGGGGGVVAEAPPSQRVLRLAREIPIEIRLEQLSEGDRQADFGSNVSAARFDQGHADAPIFGQS